MDKITDTRARADILADLERAEAVARATECGIEGCDRSMHDGIDAPEKWGHRVASGNVGGKDIRWELAIDHTGAAYVAIDAQFDGELDDVDLELMATEYSKIPAQLRQLAAQVKARNA